MLVTAFRGHAQTNLETQEPFVEMCCSSKCSQMFCRPFCGCWLFTACAHTVIVSIISSASVTVDVDEREFAGFERRCAAFKKRFWRQKEAASPQKLRAPLTLKLGGRWARNLNFFKRNRSTFISLHVQRPQFIARHFSRHILPLKSSSPLSAAAAAAATTRQQAAAAIHG